MSAPSLPAPSGDDWQVAPPLPADRGLVARLLEERVLTDPALAELAPGVLDGSQRAGAWLARPRPAWSAVVADPGHSPRRLLGYADVLADHVDPSPGPTAAGPAVRHRLRILLLSPAAAGTPVGDLLRAAAASAARDLDGAAEAAVSGPFPDEDGLPETRFAPAVLVRRRPVAAVVGAAAIVLGGVAAVLAVQIGVGPLGGVLPFLAPDDPATSSSLAPGSTAGGADEPGDSSVTAPAQPVLGAGAPIAPLPGPGAGPDGAAPGTPGAPGGPGGPGTPPPGPPPAPPGGQPGLASSLLDPVVSTAVTVVDGATGGSLAPATSLVEGTTDGATDLLDQTVGQVLGLLPRPRR